MNERKKEKKKETEKGKQRRRKTEEKKKNKSKQNYKIPKIPLLKSKTHKNTYKNKTYLPKDKIKSL